MCTTDIPMTIWHLTNNLERLDGLRLCEFNDDELLALHHSLQQIDHKNPSTVELPRLARPRTRSVRRTTRRRSTADSCGTRKPNATRWRGRSTVYISRSLKPLWRRGWPNRRASGCPARNRVSSSTRRASSTSTRCMRVPTRSLHSSGCRNRWRATSPPKERETRPRSTEPIGPDSCGLTSGERARPGMLYVTLRCRAGCPPRVAGSPGRGSTEARAAGKRPPSHSFVGGLIPPEG